MKKICIKILKRQFFGKMENKICLKCYLKYLNIADVYLFNFYKKKVI